MDKNRFFIFLLIIFQPTFTFSQSIQRSVFSSAGSNGFGTSSIQSNFGELLSSTISTTSNKLSQGFVQNDQMTINVNTLYFETLSGKAFPNPVLSDLTIEVNAIDCSDIIIKVVDVLGKTQSVETTSNALLGKELFILNFNTMIPGIYFVDVSSSKNHFNKVFKITKG